MEPKQAALNDGEQPPVVIINQADLALVKKPRAGDRCPACGMGQLDYDGMLNLACGACGYTLAGCFT